MLNYKIINIEKKSWGIYHNLQLPRLTTIEICSFSFIR